MKRFLLIAAVCLLFSGCINKSQHDFEDVTVKEIPSDSEEISIVETFEKSPVEEVEKYFDEGKIFTSHEYHKLSDGSYKCGDYYYRYRLEITGRMHNAAKDSTYIILSNSDDITFDMAWKASGFSSNMDDYFKPEDAIIVGRG